MSDKKSGRPTRSRIDLEALAFNLRSVRSFIGQSTKIMAVVKADAYGHGLVECARRLAKEGIDWFGVALPEEGVKLRKAGIEEPILCLGSFWSGQEDLIFKYDLTPVIYQLENADVLDKLAKLHQKVINIHVKVDTGMGRIGVRYDAIEIFAEKIVEYTNLKVDGLMTHFAVADDLSQNAFTNEQIDKFDRVIESFATLGVQPTFTDLANSPGAIAHPTSRSTMVRLGGILYGLGGDVLPEGIAKPELRPVLSLLTKIAHLKAVPAGESIGYGRTFKTDRDSTIASLPIGYADGLPRGLSNIGNVLIKGAIVPIVGRISMDWTLVDVSGLEDIQIGDEVVIIGRQNTEQILSEDIARSTNTISYEITCGIKYRVPREFLGD